MTNDLIVLPSYSGLTWFARKITRSAPSITIGLCLLEFIGGKLRDIVPVRETWDWRTAESL